MNESVVESIPDRVAAGAAWLDLHEPGWVERIDLETLDLGDCDLCVGGQLVGYYWTAVQRWWPGGDIWSTFDWSDAHGFSLPEFESDSEAEGEDEEAEGEDEAAYAALTAEWRRHVTARRALAS